MCSVVCLVWCLYVVCVRVCLEVSECASVHTRACLLARVYVCVVVCVGCVRVGMYMCMHARLFFRKAEYEAWVLGKAFGEHQRAYYALYALQVELNYVWTNLLLWLSLFYVLSCYVLFIF